MKNKALLVSLISICVLLYGCGKEVFEKSNEHAKQLKSDVGRYTFFSTNVGVGNVDVPVLWLLDTKTGKVWQNQKGAFVGVTIEGLVYSSNDFPDFYEPLKKAEMKGVSEKKKKQYEEVLGEIALEFSYTIDGEKMKRIWKEAGIERE